MNDDNLNISLRPQRCPQCGYLLRGLPDPIRCPECGEQMARGEIVLFGFGSQQAYIKNKLKDHIALVCTAIVALVALMAFNGAFSGMHSADVGLCLLLTLIVGTLVGLSLGLQKWFGESETVVRLRPDGYSIRARAGPAKIQAWPNEARVVIDSSVNGYMIVRVRNGISLFPWNRLIDLHVQMSWKESQALSQRLQRWFGNG